MERLTIPDEKIDGGLRRTVIDPRKVKEYAMTIYWALKKYEDIGLTPEQLIKIHGQSRWNPVEERLPEENQEVWITTKYGEVKRAMYTEHLGNNEVKIFLLIGGTENIEEVSAWQPYYVPEPYVPEND